MRPETTPNGVGIAISASVPVLTLLLKTAQPPVIESRRIAPFTSWLSTLKLAGSGFGKVVRGARTVRCARGKWAMRETVNAGGCWGKITEGAACDGPSTWSFAPLQIYALPCSRTPQLAGTAHYRAA
jgi:hypothetical protein